MNKTEILGQRLQRPSDSLASFQVSLTPDQLLHLLAESRLVPLEEIRRLQTESDASTGQSAEQLVGSLVERGFLNDYQARRVLGGQVFGLVLGNYRVLDVLGSGGMGVVYKAEHTLLKRPVALKVLVTDDDGSSVFLQRFTSEMQALAALHHPNIVLAFDAGELEIPHERGKTLCFLVMEYVSGLNLEEYVQQHGPLPIPLACDFIRQAACGLRHANERGLIHRDIKPSNLLITSLQGNITPLASGHQPGQWLVKILDFGLARLYRRRCTEAYTALGTVDYMAPEQARDARSVDIRADIYALGGTFYWLLTGSRPFPSDRPVYQELLARQYESPQPPRQLRPDIPLEVEAIICQMMARDPGDRYPTPLAVITAIDDFLESLSSGSDVYSPAFYSSEQSHSSIILPSWSTEIALSSSSEEGAGHHLLLVSSRHEIRRAWRITLESEGFRCREAASENEAKEAIAVQAPQLIAVDEQLLDGTGHAFCRKLRKEAPCPHLKIVLLTETTPGSLPASAEICDEVVFIPAGPQQLVSRIRLLVRLRDSEERSDRLASHLLATNGQLEQALQQRDNTASQAQDVLIFAMAKMAELRGQESSSHLLRMQQYVRVLAEEARRLPAFASNIDDTFVRMIERSVLLHDIGKVAIPDHVLLKPAKLDVEERSIMETHTVLGASLLEAVARQHGACLAFLSMAIDVARHHHEQYDGSGYPDGLVGDAIPLAARITAVADVYDAMRSKLVYKPALNHPAARRLILSADNGQFDPALLVAFRHCEEHFKEIFDRSPD